MTRFAKIDTLLQEAVGDVFPAAQLQVVDAFSRVYAQAVGDCSGDTWFDVASLTKALATTVLTFDAVAAGRLTLDSEPRPGLRVRDLLAHASGLPGWKPLGHDRAQVLRTVAAEPLEAPPGTRSVYSDLGFILLGSAVERALGQPLDAAFDARVAAPLGLSIGFGPRPPERCAPTENGLRGVVHDDNARAMGGVAGHAGLFGSAADVSRIAHALVAAWHGVRSPTVPRLLPSALVRQMWTPAGVPHSTWCLGWDSPSAEGSSAGARWPRDGVGHLGFTGCSIWIDPPRARWVVLLSNRVNPTRANDRIKAFRPLLHDAIVSALDD